MRLPVWSVCDRCGFNFYRKTMRKEAYGVVVCRRCYDGAYDKLRHPQNRPPRNRLNPSVVPGGRAPLDDNTYLLTEDAQYLLQEDNGRITVEFQSWNPAMSAFGG